MDLHPAVFALLTYGITIVIAACVGLIIKAVAFLVQRRQTAAPEKNNGGEGGTPS